MPDVFFKVARLTHAKITLALNINTLVSNFLNYFVAVATIFITFNLGELQYFFVRTEPHFDV
jgi:hypothetical protein